MLCVDSWLSLDEMVVDLSPCGPGVVSPLHCAIPDLFALRFTRRPSCSTLSWQEIGRWEKGRSQGTSLLPSVLLTVSPSAVYLHRTPCPTHRPLGSENSRGSSRAMSLTSRLLPYPLVMHYILCFKYPEWLMFSWLDPD